MDAQDLHDISPLNLDRSVPDYALLAPQRPILPWREACSVPLHLERSRWAQQTCRRAVILAVARQMVAAEGVHHFGIRRLAAQARVTPPTIYNLVGCRAEVLRRAVGEAHATKISFAAARAEAEDINPVLAYVDTLWTALSREPSYSRQIIPVLAGPSQDGDLSRHIRRSAENAILSWLLALDGAGQIRRSIDLIVVARLLNRQLTQAVDAWAKGELSLAELRRDMTLGTAAMLLGIVEGAETRRVEIWLC